MESRSQHTAADASASFFVATVIAVATVLLTDSSELGVIAWTTVFAWCFEGGATLEQAKWVRSAVSEHNPKAFLKDAAALALWPLVARQIQKTRGRKK